MVDLESKRLPVSKEVTYERPLLLRGASNNEIREIIGLSPQIANTDQQKSILFAKKLLEERIIGEDITYYNELQKLYRTNKRELPKDLVERLRLEAFLRARIGVKGEDYGLLDRFFAIGKSIDPEWFSKSNNNTYKDDQSFIRDRLNKGNNSRNGNNHGVADIAEQLENEQFQVYGEELQKSLGSL